MRKDNKKLLTFAVILKNISDKDIEKIKADIRRLRKKSTKELLKKASD